jgi:hypothetical protein
VNNNISLTVPLNCQILEYSDQRETINNISSIDIDLPSLTWSITNIEMNFTDIEYHSQETKIFEDTPIKDDLFLKKHGLQELGVQIALNDTTKILGVYINIKTIVAHEMDEIYFQIRGFNSSGNVPNSDIYGQVDLNHTIDDGWNYQNFTSPITLPQANYFLVMGGHVHAGAEYHWYYNDLSPNNPDLYISTNNGSGWINSTQGSPFLYKLNREIKIRDIYPEEFNMIAEIDGTSYKILNGTYKGSGILNLPSIDYSPNNETVHIPIIPDKFFFNLSYYLKLENQFLSSALVNINEEEDNFWTIVPDINRCNYNYYIKMKLPNNYYNLVVLKDDTDITASEDIMINGDFLYILNNTIENGATWEITMKSPNRDFTYDLIRGFEFELGEELIFSVFAPVIEGNFTFILYNGLGAEIDKKIIPVISDKTVYSYNISSYDLTGNWTAYIYWNNYYDAGIKSQEFKIISSSSTTSNIAPFPVINILIIIIIGGVVIGGISASLTIYQVVKRKKKRSELNLKKLSDKSKDILSLNYLMVSDVKSGVNVYEQSFMGKSMDPSLISGFLDAVRNFGIELTGAYRKTETMSLDYEDSIILVNESKDFRLIVILSEKPSEVFTNSITDLANDIEENYGDLIQKFRGGAVSQFSGISELTEMHLHVSFASPLRINFAKKANLTTLENSVLKNASEIMKQTNLNYFYTSFLMPDQKFDPEMTKTIFNLINKKIFQPIDLEE